MKLGGVATKTTNDKGKIDVREKVLESAVPIVHG
jgi:hypothetical protein